MSALEPTSTNETANLEELPTFDLRYLYDDTETPSELTIFSPDMETLTTSWITIDASHAVPLEDIR